jgi:hypothetical protein
VADSILLLYRRVPTQIGNLILDGTLSETHNRSADVTEHEVETGANVADHVRLKPATLQLDGIMTNTPISRQAVVDYAEDGPFELEGAPGQQETPGRAENAFSLLETLFEARNPITVITNLKTYENMIIDGITAPRDAKTGDAVRVTISLKQVRLVSNKLTTVETRKPGGKKKQKLGDKAGVEKPKEEYRSALSRMTGIGQVGEGLD